jgi:hypothetical protein
MPIRSTTAQAFFHAVATVDRRTTMNDVHQTTRAILIAKGVAQAVSWKLRVFTTFPVGHSIPGYLKILTAIIETVQVARWFLSVLPSRHPELVVFLALNDVMLHLLLYEHRHRRIYEWRSQLAPEA